MPERIQQLSAAMAAGDSDAVDAFYREYFDWMYWQARRVTRRDESFCLDVVQDAVLRVIRTVKAVDSESRFRGWLRLVVQTTAFDQLRSERRRKNREAMAGPVADDVDVDSLQLDWLEQQISAMDPQIVSIIELRFKRSWSLRKIAEALGISVGAVDGRLRRAIKNLKLSADEPPLPVLAIETVQVPAIAAVLEPETPTLDEPHDVLSPEVVPLDLPDPVMTPAVELSVLDQPESPVPLRLISADVISSELPVAATAPAIELSILAQDESQVLPEATSPDVISPSVPDVAATVAVDRSALDQTALDLPSDVHATADDLVSMSVATSHAVANESALVDSSTIAMPEPVRSAARAAVSIAAPARMMPIVATQILESVVIAEAIEWPELVGLEDEAGWYDDAL